MAVADSNTNSRSLFRDDAGFGIDFGALHVFGGKGDVVRLVKRFTIGILPCSFFQQAVKTSLSSLRTGNSAAIEPLSRQLFPRHRPDPRFHNEPEH